jgi:3-hydroxybutyryl-CoA dehydratase
VSIEPRLHISELSDKMVIPSVTRHITQANIDLYAEASRDFNPIHIDEDFAKKTPLGGTIAHGMLVLAYVSHMMTMAFGRAWLTGGQLNVRFKTPARPGDTLTVSGKVHQIERDGTRVVVKCDVLCQNQKGESIVTGEAVLKTEEK